MSDLFLTRKNVYNLKFPSTRIFPQTNITFGTETISFKGPQI